MMCAREAVQEVSTSDHRQLFVWDLHGTLECGTDRSALEISNQALATQGFTERLSAQDGARLFGLKWWEIFSHVLPDAESHVWDSLQDDCFALSAAQFSPHIQPTPHSHDVLTYVGKFQRQILLSATRHANLRQFMRGLGLDQFFPPGAYYAVDGHSGDRESTKISVLSGYLRTVEVDEVVVIGDTRTDMLLATAVGAVGVLFNHPHTQRKDTVPADVYTSDLRDVLSRVKGVRL